MYTIRKRFSFSAAHHLLNLVEGHPCSRQHGHNYEVEIILSLPLPHPATGFVRDYRDLDLFKKWLDETCDHKDLNEVFPGMQTSAENLCYTFYKWCKEMWPEVVCVRVSETPKTWAEYQE